MINKLPKEFLEKLSQEEQDILKNTFDSEAKIIRESIEKKMVKPSEYKNLEQELTKIKINQELNNIDEKNRGLISDFVGNDFQKLEEVKTKYPHIFEKKEVKTLDIENIIKNGVETKNEPDILALEQRYINGEKLSKQDENLLFSKLVEKAIN